MAVLTYCGNVHAAEDLDGWLQAVRRFAAPIAAGRARPFGLGVWWGSELAATLRGAPAAVERVRGALDEHGLEVATLNVFPFGAFHAERVKLDVYVPDWSREERLAYTRDAAEVAAVLAPEGAVVPLSTLPVGYGEVDARRAARNLARAASALADLEQRSGRTCVLALEPEPCCAVETAAATAEFLEEHVFGATGSPVPEQVLRRHLGVCLDLCHLAVVGEDPLRALAALGRAGIRVPKVQVSACLELREPAAALDELLAFDEPRYLHQTASGDGTLRALDLGEVAARREEFEAAALLRTHFHLPVYWDTAAALGSTRRTVEEFVRGVCDLDDPPLLEIETYTWTVLDPAWRPDRDLVAGIRAELDFVQALLSGA